MVGKREEYVWARATQGGRLHAISEHQVATVQEAMCGYDPDQLWGRTDLKDTKEMFCATCVEATRGMKNITAAVNRAVAKLDGPPRGVSADEVLSCTCPSFSAAQPHRPGCPLYLSRQEVDGRVMARLRAPFGCELIPPRTMMLGTDPGRWRIHDANDDAVASCAGAEGGYARLIVQALNEHFERRTK